jgi:hypothetical protein
MRVIFKGLKVIFLILTLGVASYVAWFCFCWNVRYPAEMRHWLGEAKKPQEAIGPWGVYLEIRGGGWVAIAYEDSHAPFLISRSIALTSSGKWLKSSKHYCAGLMAYAGQREFCSRNGLRDDVALERVVKGDPKCMGGLFKAEVSQGVDDAITYLKEIGFVEISS